MSISIAQSALHYRLQASLTAIRAEHPLCIFTSFDRVSFDAFALSSSFQTTTVTDVLPTLHSRFVIQATGPYIRAALDSAPWPHNEVEIASGYNIQIIDSVAQLGSAAGCLQSAVFARADGCLVLWSDSEDGILSSWHDIICRLQYRFGSAVILPTPLAALLEEAPGEDIDQLLRADEVNYYEAGTQSEDFLQVAAGSLPSLDDLSFLATVDGLTTGPGPLISGANPSPPYSPPYAYPPWQATHNVSPGMSDLQLAFQHMDTFSPYSDAALSTLQTPTTVNMAIISPPPANLYADFVQEEDTASDASLELSPTPSDGFVSPRASPSTQSPASPPPDSPAHEVTPVPMRRYSHGESPAPRVTGKKAKRDPNDGDDDYTPDDRDETSSLGGRRNFKRRRSIIAPTSAPACLSIPLPAIDPPPQAIYEAAESSSATVPGSQIAPATGKPPPKARRRAGGSTKARVKRTGCEFCGKTFTRLQDAYRHAQMSCKDNPAKEGGIECPECGSVLSRLDAAQRHWRGHENPRAPVPEWVGRSG
ncbi:hypothetical protein BC834DRAFT_969992 [Gloeopeniophorella convolvens]|nr:hypothetical protein BC834DRAFT_969992 [Gloeopeniophorella convolvens]